MDNLTKYADELSKKKAGADIAQEMGTLYARVEKLLKLEVIEQSRDELDTTGVKFTASNVLTRDNDNAIGKIDVTPSAKSKDDTSCHT